MGHLKDIGESYMEHLQHAWEIGSVLYIASIAQFVHSFIPAFHPPSGFDIETLIKFLESKRPEARK